MKEKDLQQKLNQELKAMTPDVLENILSQARQPEENAQEQLHGNRSLFQRVTQHSKTKWMLGMAAVFMVAITTVAMLVISNHSMAPNHKADLQVAYSIMLDVNPSIQIDVGHNGKVMKLCANNRDAQSIVEKINQVVKEDTACEQVIQMVLSQTNKQNYFKKKESAMLVSVSTSRENLFKEKNIDIKKIMDKVLKSQKIKCESLYQEFVVTDEIQSVARENNVSLGKAALCLKLAKKSKKNLSKICKQKIFTLVKEARKKGVVVSDEMIDISSSEYATDSSESIETDTIGGLYEDENVNNVDNQDVTDNREMVGAGDIISPESVNELKAIGN